MTFWPVLFFWPAVAVGLLAAGVGLLWRRSSLLVAGAFLVLPVSLYLSVPPRMQYVGLLPAACQLIAAVAVRRGKQWIAWALLTGVAVFFGWLAWVVTS